MRLAKELCRSGAWSFGFRAPYWECPKIRGTLLRGPYESPIFGNPPILRLRLLLPMTVSVAIAIPILDPRGFEGFLSLLVSGSDSGSFKLSSFGRPRHTAARFIGRYSLLAGRVLAAYLRGVCVSGSSLDTNLHSWEIITPQ